MSRGHFGLVGEIEGRIDVGLERKLAQQRQAERVDGADGDVAEPVAQLQPAPPIELRMLAGATPQLANDPLAHLGGRLAGEGDREDVRRVDPGLSRFT